MVRSAVDDYDNDRVCHDLIKSFRISCRSGQCFGAGIAAELSRRGGVRQVRQANRARDRWVLAEHVSVPAARAGLPSCGAVHVIS